jgi:hypothetical protein
MHQALRQEFNNLKVLAQKKSVPLSIIETQLDHVVFISSEKKLVCLVIEENEIHNMLTCFKVNKKKWQWAEDEGFVLSEGLPDNLAHEILVKFKTPQEYLNYLGL